VAGGIAVDMSEAWRPVGVVPDGKEVPCLGKPTSFGIGSQGSECRNRCIDALGIFRCGVDPDVQVLRVAHIAVEYDGLAANDQVLNVLGVALGQEVAIVGVEREGGAEVSGCAQLVGYLCQGALVGADVLGQTALGCVAAEPSAYRPRLQIVVDKSPVQ